MNLAGAAKYLSVKERTIRKYLAEGRLKAYRLAGLRLLRFKQEDLDALLQPLPSNSEFSIRTPRKGVVRADSSQNTLGSTHDPQSK